MPAYLRPAAVLPRNSRKGDSLSHDFIVLGMAGSLGRRSYNRALLAAAADSAPDDIAVETFDLGSLSLYNPDLDELLPHGGPSPEAVTDLVERVRAADALLLVSPEYNWGPSGVMRNALDWISRPAGASPLFEKPVALAGASPGPAGTGRGQLQLRQNLLSSGAFVLQQPVVQVGEVKSRFDDGLNLVHEPTRELLREQLSALRDWALRVTPASASA